MSDSETLRRLVVECLERLDDEGPAVVEELCAAHPAQAEGLRRRLAILGGAGLIGSRAAGAEVPGRLGDFRLLRRLGGGGMGVVHEAEQVSLQRRVALKLVRPEQLWFPGARERFRREVEAIARLDHPGVVAIHAVGEEQGIPFFAMELVAGLTLAEVGEALAGRDPAELGGADLGTLLAERLEGETAAFEGSWEVTVAGLLRQAAEALEHCHRRGVLHRDVKPSNLMLGADGRVQLLDFGIAATGDGQRLTQSGAHLGSPAYMSPEQVRGEHEALDARTDVYSLGVTLYELLTLSHPHQGATVEDTRRSILAGAPQAPRARNRRLSRDAEAVCLQAMDVERGRRYADAGALARDLLALATRRSVSARPPSRARRTLRWIQRHPAASLALAVLVVVPPGLAWRERSARLRIEEQQRAAQAGLAAALGAVERMLLRVGDRTLADVPRMEEVRGSLLADGRALLDDLVAHHSGDPALARLSALARHRAGALEALLGRGAEAEASFRAAEELLLALGAAEGGELAAELAGLRLDRGEQLMADPARADEARADYAAVQAALAAGPADGTTRLLLSRAHANQGILHEQAGRVDEARSAYNAAIQQARAALGSDETGQAQLQLATALNSSGKLASLTGDPQAALPELEEASRLFAGLVDANPGVSDWRLRLGLTASTLGHALFSVGRIDDARVQVLLARDVFASLASDFPRVPRYRLELAGLLQAEATLATDGAAGEAALRRALELTEAVAAESPAQFDLLINLVGGHANLALTLALQGRHGDSLDSLSRSATFRRELAAVNPDEPRLGLLVEHQLRTLDMLLRAGGGEDLASLAREVLEEARAVDLPVAGELASQPWWRALEPGAATGG